MKKFLLLLVGVLFALSANAWTLYFDIKDTGWTSAPYIYCGKLKNSNDYNSGATYYNKFQLEPVYGTIYKWNQTWDGLTTIFISKTDLGNPDGYKGTDLSNYATELNGTDAYGQFTTPSGDNWKLVDNRLYVLNSTGSNGASSVTDNFAPPATKDIYIAGNDPLVWGEGAPATNYKFTRTGEYTYEYVFSSATFNTSSVFKIFEGTAWADGHGTNDANNKVVANTTYQLAPNKNEGVDVPVGETIANPTVVVNVKDWTVTFKTATTPTTYYYRLHGQIFEEGTDWKTQAVMKDNGDGTYSFEASLYAGSFGIKELPSEDATINDDNTWIRAAQGTGTISAANTPYKVAYKNSANDSGNDLSSELTGDYTIVFDKNNMTVTFVPKAQDYSGKTIAITGSFYGGEHWPMPVDGAKRFTFDSGSTYTLDLSGYTFDTNTRFQIRDVTGKENNPSHWGINYGPTNENSENKIEPGVKYTLTRSENSNDLYVTTEIKDPQLTLDVATLTLTITPKPVTPTTYSYRFHSNMVNGTWPADDNNDPAWAMTKQSDGTWMWQGTLAASGAFGFKRLSEGEAPSKNNTWFYGKENNASIYNITVLDQWYDAKEKANFTDDSGHDWTFSPNGGTYQVIFDPANTRTKIVKVNTTVDYSDRTYVISGTFNGWIAPADNKANCQFEYQTEGENRGKYVWSYTGLMKNLEFKISDLSNLAEDSDKKWGKAYGTTYTGSTRDQLTAGTETPYQLRRTNVPGEDVLVKDTELYNPTFILDPATMTLTVINNPVKSDYDYYLNSNFSGSWKAELMTKHDDGSWSINYKIPQNARFGIRQTKADKTDQTLWIISSQTSNISYDGHNCVTALVATEQPTKADTNGNQWTPNGNSAFDGNIEYTIVFTPAKDGEGNLLTDGTGTLVIYNNTAVTATIQPAKDGDEDLIVDGQKANEIVVTVPVANYLGTSEGQFSLSMGDNTIATATAVDGNVTFEYLPYLSGTREFTLSGASKSVALNVVSPTLDGELFSLSAYKSCTLIDNLTGYADAAVACEPTATLIYDIPVWYYTINGYTYEAEDVYWSTNGFSFIIKNMVAFDTNTYKATASATAYCYGTPIFPFVVRKQTNNFAVDASNLTIQQFGGSKVSFQVTVNADAQVSGVEGVAVENEEAPVEYYNLQGQRVNGELAPGIYIRRQGITVTKVRF